MCGMSHVLTISGDDKQVVAQFISHQYHNFIATVEFQVHKNYKKVIKFCPVQLKSIDIIIVKQLPEWETWKQLLMSLCSKDRVLTKPNIM